MYKKYIKRLIDIILSLSLIIILLPLIILISIIEIFNIGFPIIFKQSREYIYCRRCSIKIILC